MLRTVSSVALALAVTLATVLIQPETDERTLYGHEGPLEEYWLPRKVGGWPAPFLADNPATSVVNKIGVEDVFRPGPFFATLSFWFVIVSGLRRLGRWAAVWVDRRRTTQR